MGESHFWKFPSIKNLLSVLFSLYVGTLTGYLLTAFLRTSLTPNSPQFSFNEAFFRGKRLPSYQGDVLIGVLTAEKMFNSRVKSILQTWADNPPPNVQVMFFIGAKRQGLSNPSNIDNFPVVDLDFVDDTAYPPQKKSFAMFRHFHTHFGNSFSWFVRLDDDAYLNIENLINFVSRLNASQPHYIGQPGFGKPEEFGRLFLEKNELFCMGGTGMLLSRAALNAFAPFIPHCAANLYTYHEDVEIGRCISKHAGTPCTSALDARNYFHQEYEKSKEAAYLDDISTNSPHLLEAITLHPAKYPGQMENIHYHVLLKRADKIRQQIVDEEEPSPIQKSRNPLNVDQDVLDKQIWDFSTLSFASSPTNENPNANVPANVKKHLTRTVIPSVLAQFNRTNSDSGAWASFKSLFYSWNRLNFGFSHDCILDLLLRFHRPSNHVDDSLDLAVRRHAYVRQRFASTFEAVTSDVSVEGEDVPFVNFIVAVHGKNDSFVRFTEQFKKFEPLKRVRLIVVIHKSPVSDFQVAHIKSMFPLAATSDAFSVHVIQSAAPFSRAASLTYGVDFLKNLVLPDQVNSQIVFLVDVDVTFTFSSTSQTPSSLLARIRFIVDRLDNVYLPIVFSEYDARFATGSVFSQTRGYWRQFGFGLVALKLSEWIRVDGMDTSIKGWGREDVDFVSRLMRLPDRKQVFRAPDPVLRHPFHPIHCSLDKQEAKEMCFGTLLSTMADQSTLVDLIVKDFGNQTFKLTPTNALENSEDNASTEQLLNFN